MSLLARLAPTWSEMVPWTDKRGRFHLMRAAVFAGLLAPGLLLAFRWGADMLGPRAVNTAIHSTGYYAVWILLASLVVTPAKALFGLPNLVVVRRMIGIGGLGYALIHLALYATDQNWRLRTIATEIFSRFYLTIGFVTLLGLLLLGVTSTDGWVRFLGRAWRRLHKIIYGLCVLALAHYILQSKLDVSQALLATGVFAWLMLWRLLPAGRDRTWEYLFGLSLAAAAVTLGCEYLWYRFGTRINPLKVLASEADVSFGLRPAGQVLALGLLATGLAELRRVATTPFGKSPLFAMLVYALGAFGDDVTTIFMGWPFGDEGEDTPPVVMDLIWVVLLGLLGLARWKMRDRRLRHLFDAVWAACVLEQLLLLGVTSRHLGSICAALIVACTILLGQRVWVVSRGAALTMIPLGLLLAYEAVSLL